ncbi:hypothetical protein Vretimale_4339 [Volvox reticuliferus]|uniref:Uncharacterized protein n=1 Tax=Volvox reticuliferus TaxID=1737510 RepID=A0A8J4FFI1_9CHLO|nr:hypothetical protein Vretifemale_2947 [Volvox reticuliferus]GIL99090.1 hypothetical protein Vretimale_4339 [Volvox reticuliferus]
MQRLWAQCLRERTQPGTPAPRLKAHFPAPLLHWPSCVLAQRSSRGRLRDSNSKDATCLRTRLDLLRYATVERAGWAESRRGVRIWVAKSKTDQQGVGAEVLLAGPIAG